MSVCMFDRKVIIRNTRQIIKSFNALEILHLCISIYAYSIVIDIVYIHEITMRRTL